MKNTAKLPKRIVVKVGTSSLTSDRGALDRDRMAGLVEQMADVKHRGVDIILVTSGAIRAGMERLDIARRPKTMPEQQASAAVGQSVLMQTYTELFSDSGIVPGQVLLTRDDFHHRMRYLNARNTIYTLLRFGCLPIVNENDTSRQRKFGSGKTTRFRPLWPRALTLTC